MDSSSFISNYKQRNDGLIGIKHGRIPIVYAICLCPKLVQYKDS